MTLKLIKNQVTDRVVRLGDWIAYGGGGSPLVGSRYLYENRTPPGAAIGTIYHNTGETELYVNSQDLDGNNHYNAISTLKIGDKITVETQTGTLILRPAYVGGGLWQFFLDAWLALPDGEYLVTLERVPVVPPSEFTPSDLFASGEQGAWYDPSDFSTMFQDSAGTTPVTATGQTVGKILDKSGRGNHATQATEANRPVLQQDGNGKYYLGFDGVNDSLATAVIDFTATDKMSVFTGIYKTSNAGTQMLVELSTTSQSAAGTFAVWSPVNAGGDDVAPYLNGTAGSFFSATPFPISTAFVISSIFDIAGDSRATEIFIRKNGSIPTLAGNGSASAGTGNFTSWALYIGSRAGNSFRFNGRIYSLIVRGALSAAQEITDTETWVNGKTGAY